MIKTRVIPTILWEGPSAVKGENFNSWRKLGPVMPAINIYVARDVDEIIILNLSPNKHGSQIDFASIGRFFQNCNLPLTYGGGISRLDQIEKLLAAGVDKVSIGTSCYANKSFVREVVREFGSQFVVASVDYKPLNGRQVCFSRNGTHNEDVDAQSHSIEMVDLGVGELLLTSIEHEGCMSGYDTQLISDIRDRVSVPIILSGGAGKLEDFYEAVSNGADAVACSSAFLFTEITPKKVKQHLDQHGVHVRLDND